MRFGKQRHRFVRTRRLKSRGRVLGRLPKDRSLSLLRNRRDVLSIRIFLLCGRRRLIRNEGVSRPLRKCSLPRMRTERRSVVTVETPEKKKNDRSNVPGGFDILFPQCPVKKKDCMGNLRIELSDTEICADPVGLLLHVNMMIVKRRLELETLMKNRQVHVDTFRGSFKALKPDCIVATDENGNEKQFAISRSKIRQLLQDVTTRK